MLQIVASGAKLCRSNHQMLAGKSAPIAKGVGAYFDTVVDTKPVEGISPPNCRRGIWKDLNESTPRFQKLFLFRCEDSNQATPKIGIMSEDSIYSNFVLE